MTASRDVHARVLESTATMLIPRRVVVDPMGRILDTNDDRGGRRVSKGAIDAPSQLLAAQ